jgi:hypothetical protein
LALLLGGNDEAAQYYARLDAYDAISASDATQQLQDWRASDMAQRAA